MDPSSGGAERLVDPVTGPKTTAGAAGASAKVDPGFGGTNGSAGAGAGGFGGAGYMSSAGGTGVNNPPACGAVPVPANDLAPWQQDATARTLDDAFARASRGMPGTWHGIVTTPWIPPYAVSISFTPDGAYAARCNWASNMCCVAFYYGTDDDTPLKRYDLDWVTKEGTVGGTIDIIFGDPQDGYYQSGYQGELKNVELDATGNRLRFDFLDGGQYGPVSFDLGRVSAP